MRSHDNIRTEVQSATEKRLQCAHGQLLLGRASVRGLYLWCKFCKCTHLIEWDELASLRDEFRLVLVHKEQVS